MPFFFLRKPYNLLRLKEILADFKNIFYKIPNTGYCFLVPIHYFYTGFS